MLRVVDLHASKDGREILHGVSLDVRPGSVVTVLGPNGSGKTTLLRAIMGDPSLSVSGKIEVDGEDISGLPPHGRARRGLFLAFQSPPEVDGVTLATLLTRATGRERDPRAFAELAQLAAKLGLPPAYLSRPVNVGFSGGERKRSELLQALFLRPKYVLLDEIDSGVDLAGLRVIASTINELRDSGAGIVLVSHNPRLFDYVRPDTVVLLRDGRIVDSGTADELNRFLAALEGSQ